MSHPEDLADELDQRLAVADAELAARYPGDRGVRQPVHTVYIPAGVYQAEITADWGTIAREVLDEHVSVPDELAETFGLSETAAAQVYDRVREKLVTEPVEDVRIDFEDGYGNHTDDEEDAAAATAAAELAKAIHGGQAPPVHGIRFKSFEAPTRRRGLRTLDIFVAELARAGAVGEGFVLTLPKVTSVDQVEAMAHVCARLERAHGLRSGQLVFEVQVETPQSVVDASGRVLVAPMIHAAEGRCTGLHYGTYDYSASCGIAAEYQSMEHPAADQAKALMQVAAAGTGVFVSDGSSNVLPVGDADAVRSAWRLHARLVRRSLERGFYQGWDMHPAQLVSRFVATYAFFRDDLDTALLRLWAYVGDGDSGYLDEPATAAALAGFVLRGVECGAVGEADLAGFPGLGRPQLAELAGSRIQEER